MKMRNGLRIFFLISLLLGLGTTAVQADASEQSWLRNNWQAWFRFPGVVVSRPADDTVGTWVIAGRSVQVTQTTVFDETEGPAIVGAEVLVVARRVPVATAENGRLVLRAATTQLEALLIRVTTPANLSRRVTIRGWVTDLQPTSLVVNGLRILYDSGTDISGELRLGAWVKVVAAWTADGLKALSIEVLTASPHVVYFQGTIESISRSQWVVGGRKVGIGPHTLIIGHPQVGLQARVWALVMDSSRPSVLPARELLALLIQVVEEPTTVEWTGTIRYLPPNITIYPPVYYGQWVVEDRAVWVTRETTIIGTPRIGLLAHVWAHFTPVRKLVADKIEVLPVTPLEPRN